MAATRPVVSFYAIPAIYAIGTADAVEANMTAQPTTPAELEALARKLDRLHKQAQTLLLRMPCPPVMSDEQSEAWDSVRRAHGLLGSANFDFAHAARQLQSHASHTETIANLRKGRAA